MILEFETLSIWSSELFAVQQICPVAMEYLWVVTKRVTEKKTDLIGIPTAIPLGLPALD